MDQYFEYLNNLRDSGITNMFGAIPYLKEAFPELEHNDRRAHEILTAWMDSFRSKEAEEPW